MRLAAGQRMVWGGLLSYKNLWRMIIAVYAVVALAGGGTITVCSSGCDYSSPKAAVFAAREGDVVEVMSGRYSLVIG